MIFTEENVKQQLKPLLLEYPDLEDVHSDSQQIQLKGQILVFRTYNDFTLRKAYTLKIVFPINSDELPYVIDVNRQIRQDYHHYYSNGKLCLATDAQMRIRFIDGMDLVEWMSEFVEMYYFSYEYFERYGIFPFGERSHGSWGILQTYQDYLMANDEAETFKIMCYIKNQPYRGHHSCPCGSGKSLRNCHGQAILCFYKDIRKKKIMSDDLEIIEKELNEINEYKRNRKKRK